MRGWWIWLVIAGLGGGAAARAQSGPADVPESAADGTTVPSLAQTLDAIRDPFWPIGWTPPPPEPEGTPAADAPKGPIRWEEATRLLIVSGIARLPGDRYAATLRNVGVVEEGDRVSIEFQDMIYHWEIQTITSKGIVPRRLGISAPRGK